MEQPRKCIVAIAYDAGLTEQPLPINCSDDLVEVYHGYPTASVVCGLHAQHSMQAVGRARRALRYDAQTEHPEEP